MAKSDPLETAITDEEADARVAVLMADIRKLKKQLSGYSTRDAIIMAAVKEAWSEGVTLHVSKISKPPKQTKQAEEFALLHFTDWHFGKATRTFDVSTARLRVRKAIEATAEITNLRRRNATIRECKVLLGGDFIEGDNIFPGQAYELEGDVHWQSRCAAEALSESLLSLLQEFEVVSINAVDGNHGWQGKFSDKRTNWDSVTYESARLIVNGSLADADRKRITWDLPHDRSETQGRWYARTRLATWGLHLVHGHQFKGGGLGFPWYSSAKKAAGWSETLPEFTEYSATPQGMDYIFCGHWHTEAKQTIGKKTLLACGSIESSNEYAQESFAGVNDPHQKLYYFNQSRGLISEAKLYLDDRRPNR